MFLLGRNELMPSPFARQEWQMEQEKNLIYVAVTRARDRLYVTGWLPRRGEADEPCWHELVRLALRLYGSLEA
mgnify:CR=1 FL=1